MENGKLEIENILKPYEEYKRVDLPWVSKIPKSWELTRIKNVLEYSINGIWGDEPIESNGNNIVCIRVADFNMNDYSIKNKKLTYRHIELEQNDKRFLNKGDLLIEKSGGGEKQPVGRVVMFNGEYRSVCSNFISKLRVKKDFINNRYVLYYLNLLQEQKYILPFINQTTGIQNLNEKLYFNNYILIPPKEEQDQIVRYLDSKLSKINKFIKAKKKQVKLLKELKQAIINQAVTKGLDPNVKMKPSGIECLGDIPEGWEMKPLRQLLSPISIKNRPDLPLLSVVREQGVIVRDIENIEENHNFIPDDLSGYKVVKEGQFVINKMKAWQGSYGVSKYTGIVSPAYYVFNLFFENKEYFHYAIRSKAYVNFFAQASDGIRIGQWDLSLQKMKEIPFIIPSENEQKEIVEYISKMFSLIDKAIESIKKQIDLITEYRTSLISNVVTGKVDVRNIEVEDSIEGVEEDFEDLVEEDVEEDIEMWEGE